MEARHLTRTLVLAVTVSVFALAFGASTAQADSCTRGQGYWGTHSMYGPSDYDPAWGEIGENTPFFNSGMTYYRVIAHAVEGNPYFSLGQVYIATALNFQSGCPMPEDVVDAFNDATVMFQAYGPNHNFKNDPLLRKAFQQLKKLLGNYNTAY